MNNAPLYPRYLRGRLLEALLDSPVTLIHGPRQCGKTTLVGDELGYTYLTFDDEVQRGAASADPVGYVADLPLRVVLDEVQKVPELFPSLKAAVDARRQPGRFILTGSANVLLVPRLADSLVGRMEVLRLHPLSQVELAGGASSFLADAFAANFTARRTGTRLGAALAERVVAGGFPAALSRTAGRRRAGWYRDYVDTLIQRDVHDLARIRSLDTLPRLVSLAAGQSATLWNVSKLAAPFELSRQTIGEYLALLQGIFLIEELPAWHSNRLKRLVKTPKLHLGDTGLLCGFLGLDPETLRQDRRLYGRVVETFVYLELRRQAGWYEDAATFSHFRDKDQVEVGIVIESGNRLVGIEVKAAATVGEQDFKGLRALRQAAGDRFAAGVLLYDGEATVGFGDRLSAVPISTLWG